MTWRELKNFINKRARNNKSFLDADVNLYNFDDGSEHDVDITELSCNKEESDNEDGTNWVVYLSINDKDANDETETTEASVD
jgi:hypothetical protein